MKTKYVFTVLSILLLLACFVGSVSALTEDTVSLTNSAKSIYLSTELSDADKSQQLSELCGWDARLALYTQAEMIENEETGEVTLNYNGLDTSGVTDLYDFYTGSQAYSEYLQNMNFVYENFERVIVMAHGKILCDGTPDEVFSKSDILDKAKLQKPDIVDLYERLCR